MDRLSNELLGQIFDFFVQGHRADNIQISGYNVDKKSLAVLASLTRTCKHFKELVEPLLYKRYVKLANALDYKSQREAHPPNTAFRKFLRTLIHRPDLGRCVKYILLETWEVCQELKTTTDFAPLTPSDKEFRRLFRNAASRFDIGQPTRRWIKALCDYGHEDAEIELLLTLTPNVAEIQFHHPLGRIMPDLYFKWMVTTRPY